MTGLTLVEFKRELRKRKTALRREIKKSESQSATFGVKIAKTLSSGPFSQMQLNAMDNPYAVRHGTAQIAPDVINVQTGKFRAAWKREVNDWTGSPPDALLTKVINTSGVAKYMLGTKRMLPRPVDALTAKILEPVRMLNLGDALERALE